MCASATVTADAVGRGSRQSIANSTLVSQNPGIGTDQAAPILATEVSRDFIPPCPAQISPAQAAALGPAIEADAEP